MAHGIHKLKAKTVETTIKRGFYGDGGGLYLQITKTGGKSWLFRYMVKGKAKGMGLGPLRMVSLAEARNKAHECRAMLYAGVDPLDAKARNLQSLQEVASKSRTFEQCAADYIAANKAGWKKEKHKEQWENTLKTYAHPTIGAMSVELIQVGNVIDVLTPIWTTKTETASRVRGRIESVLGWATAHGYRSGDNPARWRGLLDKLLPKPSSVAKVTHHPALPYAEMSAFIKELRGDTSISTAALEFLILTASRTSEAIEATFQEFDLANAIWTVPSERMKAGRPHRVPLSSRAVEIVKHMKKVSRGKYVFPGRKSDKHLSNMALLQLLERMKRVDITSHGFRSTFRDWAAECTNHSREICEAALAHVVKDKTEAAYQRGDLFQKRARLMDDWANYCDGVETLPSPPPSTDGQVSNVSHPAP